MLEVTETIIVEQNENNHNLSITHIIKLATMPKMFAFNHIFSYYSANSV